jgi:anti-anti-sigma factor
MAQPGFSLFEQDNCAMVKIEGNARVETAVLLKQELSRMQIDHEVAIDWSDAEHVDACVLQVLLAFRKSLAKRGFSLMVDKDNPKVRNYLKLSGLAQFFPVRDGSLHVPPVESANA